MNAHRTRKIMTGQLGGIEKLESGWLLLHTLIGTDDKGNQGLYRMTNYGGTETVFEESRNNTKYKGISPDAKTVTLELYVNKEEKNRTTYKKYETGIEDTYGEGEGRVYESDEDPLDLYSQVEGKIEIKVR